MKSGPTLNGWMGTFFDFNAAKSIEVNAVLPLLLCVPAMISPLDFIRFQSVGFLKNPPDPESNAACLVLVTDEARLRNETSEPFS